MSDVSGGRCLSSSCLYRTQLSRSKVGYLAAPVVGVITGLIILGEAITFLDIVGIAITTAGIVLVLVAQQRRTVAAA